MFNRERGADQGARRAPEVSELTPGGTLCVALMRELANALYEVGVLSRATMVAQRAQEERIPATVALHGPGCHV